MNRRRTSEASTKTVPELPDDVSAALVAALCEVQKANGGRPIPSRVYNGILARHALWDHAKAGRVACALERGGYAEAIGRGTPGFAYRMTEAALLASANEPEALGEAEARELLAHGVRRPDYFQPTTARPASRRAENGKKARDRKSDEDTADHDSVAED